MLFIFKCCKDFGWKIRKMIRLSAEVKRLYKGGPMPLLNTIYSRAFLFCERKMISQKEFAFLVMKIFIWILTGTFWHGLCSTMERHGVLLAWTFIWMILNLMFWFVPGIRREIRSAFAAYSWIYLVYFGIVSFLNGFSYFIQGLHVLKVIKEIIILPPFSPFHLHIYVLCEKVMQYVYWKIKELIMTSNNAIAEIQIKEIFDDGLCAICMGPHENPSRPHCGHTFCFECLRSWCLIKKACPLCSKPVTAIKSEQQTQFVDDFSQISDITLIQFDDDELNRLGEELLEIGRSIVMFGRMWLINWCIHSLWIYAAAICKNVAVMHDSNAPEYIYGRDK